MSTQVQAEETREARGEPSTFALDVYFAQGTSGDPAIDAHVASCARCRDYLVGLDAGQVSGPPLSLVKPPVRRRWALPVAGALAVAAGVALLLRSVPPAKEEGYVGAKGAPAVQLLVHRDRDTRIWDGRSALRPGDALALKVACEGLKRVVVASPSPTGWARLEGAACPDRDEALPFTLRVDGEPGDEKLAVVLSQDAIDDAALQTAIAERTRTQDVWVVTFTMPKETETNP